MPGAKGVRVGRNRKRAGNRDGTPRWACAPSAQHPASERESPIPPASPADRSSSAGRRRFTPGVIGVICLGSYIFGMLLYAAFWAPPNLGAGSLAEDAPFEKAPRPTDIREFDKLIRLDAKQIAERDMARLNLTCALGLPGAENLNVDAMLAVLDTWVAGVKFETDRHLYKFAQNPAEYDNSEGYFRILMMITVLQKDCNVHYNPGRIRDPDFKDSQDLFIHGLLGERRAGTCSNMPVLYVAVGRRLGYPIKLVSTKGHLFARWDGGDADRFNIEGAGRGMSVFSDDHYKTWPMKMTDAEIKSGMYLNSMTPAEELACFLATHGHCVEELGRFADAEKAYQRAVNLLRGTPRAELYAPFLRHVVRRRQPVKPYSPENPPRAPWAEGERRERHTERTTQWYTNQARPYIRAPGTKRY